VYVYHREVVCKTLPPSRLRFQSSVSRNFEVFLPYLWMYIVLGWAFLHASCLKMKHVCQHVVVKEVVSSYFCGSLKRPWPYPVAS
jgi:hypothetical protein